MLNSFLLGFLGTMLRLIGVALFVVWLIAVGSHSPSAVFWFFVTVGALFGGGYAKYLSRQTVRVRP